MQTAIAGRPLPEWFRGVVFWLEADRRAVDFSVPAKSVGDWLIALDGWHRQAIEAADGPRINGHLLYERSATMQTPVPPEFAEPLIHIGQTCLEIGVRFAATLTLTGAADETASIERLAQAGAIAGMAIERPDARVGENWLAHVERLALAGVQLEFVGPFEAFKRLGVPASPILSARAHRYTRQAGASRVAAGVGCGRRFGLHIAADGGVYPCLALLGVASAKIGQVGEGPGPSFLTGSSLDLAQLAAKGPRGAIAAAPAAETCNRHRAAMLAIA